LEGNLDRVDPQERHAPQDEGKNGGFEGEARGVTAGGDAPSRANPLEELGQGFSPYRIDRVGVFWPEEGSVVRREGLPVL
jgi:hypothetical protein